MKYKLMALDIDGTLTDSHKRITERTRKALIDLQKRWIKIALASGRPTPGVAPLVEELELKKYGGYLLSFNGAYILECSTGKIIFEEMLPHGAVKFIYPMAKTHHCGILTYENNEIITEMPENRYVQLEAAINKMKVKKVDSLEEYIDFPVPKFLIVQDGDYLAEVEKLMTAAIGANYSIYRSEPYFLEIMPRNIDKAYSLSFLTKSLHINRENIAACGDSYNDITMLQYAGLGIAMGNGRDIVRDTADFITLSNDEEGIVYAVEKILAGLI